MVEQLTIRLKLLIHAETSWSQVRVLPTALIATDCNPTPRLSDRMHRDINAYSRRLDYQLRRLQADAFSDKTVILEYLKELMAQGMNLSRIAKLCFLLRVIRKQLGKDFMSAEKQDLQNLVIWIEQQKDRFQAWARSDIKALIKRFYRRVRVQVVLQSLPCSCLSKRSFSGMDQLQIQQVL